MKEFIQKRKGIIIVILLAIVVLVLSSIKIYLPQKETAQGTIVTETPIDEQQYIDTFLLPVGIQNQIDEKTPQTQKAISSKEKLISVLPIYVENFKTSNDRLTTLNVYTIPEDPNYLVRIEIYGIDYQIQNTNLAENPDAVAFIDSFKEIKKRLTDKGVNIKDLYFIFSERAHIQTTAELWVNEFRLLQ
jgi:hypothetical protein